MGEPWIRVHANLAGRPVVWRAVEALGVTAHEAVGLLVQFWGSVAQHATNGRVAGLSDSQLEAWAGWTRKRGKFAAFIRASHLDADGCVNEWEEYAGKLEDRKEKDRNRKRTRRGSPQDVRGNSDGIPQTVRAVSAPTKRNDNETLRNEEVVDDLAHDGSGAPILEPGLTALYLTVCANKAIASRWGEQPNALTQGSAVAMVEELSRQGIEWQVARLSIYRQCRDSKQTRPPMSSVGYFRPGIEAAWAVEVARRAMAQSGETAPDVIAMRPKTLTPADELQRWVAETDAREKAEKHA